MSYRNDHDAALARATALETALERERADDARRAARLEQVERELADTRAKLALVRPDWVAVPAPAKHSPKATAALLSLLFLLSVIALCCRSLGA